MLDRCVLNSQIALIHKNDLDVPVRLEVWVAPEVRDGLSSSSVFVSERRDRCSQNLGVPLCRNKIHKIHLPPGQELYGKALDEALLGLSILPGGPA